VEMKNNIIIPKLNYVKITNYSLYNKDIYFEFINGVNLILGGNGVGKTTFVNIIKYALIGLYKKDLIVRNYQGEKRLNRVAYKNCNTYFRNRTNNTIEDENAQVELSFDLGELSFVVKRSLYETKILEASVMHNSVVNNITGEIIRQDKYENLSNNEKSSFLQYNYEQQVSNAANMSDFDDFIFFISQILMFGEDRANVLWDEKVQNRLFNNYLNDLHLEKKRKEYSYEAKYQDSISRHKQEEIKAIRKVVDSLKSNNYKMTEKEIIDLQSQIEKKENSLKTDIIQQEDYKNKIRKIYKSISDESIKIDKKEKELYELENISEYWTGLNPNYFVFKKQLISNHICPMCNSQITNEKFKSISENECFFCHSKISSTNNQKVANINIGLRILLDKRHSLEIQEMEIERDLKELDDSIRKKRIELFELRNKLKSIENADNSKPEDETSYGAMVNQINKLSMEKEAAQKKCELMKTECNKILLKIDDDLIESTISISRIFNNFAEAFLRVPCSLSLDSSSDGKTKLFVPIIDGKSRFDAEELSESQRFFVDYSFRMSILAYFYNAPTFYICETPDSSLDISYEENAANTLVKYLDNPNSLILTSNLNNSTFIKCLLKKNVKVNILNLLKYGKVSEVQTNHQILQNLSNEIEEIVNE